MTPTLFRLGLLLTLRCNAECRHCLFKCSPNNTEKIPRNLAVETILGAKKLGASWVSFSGGEPFLEFKLLEGLVKRAHFEGMKTEVVTNGFWADSLEVANKTLVPLVESGLDVLNLSIDDFHEEFIPLLKIRNAYRSAVGLGLKIVLMVSPGKNPRITSEKVTRLLGDDKIQVLGQAKVKNPNAFLFETQFTPVGRGVDLEYDPQLFTHVSCKAVLRDIGVKPNGDVLPCCGPLGAKVTLGNLNKESLENILERVESYPRITRIQKGFNMEGVYSSKCHACLENKVGKESPLGL